MRLASESSEEDHHMFGGREFIRNEQIMDDSDSCSDDSEQRDRREDERVGNLKKMM